MFVHPPSHCGSDGAILSLPHHSPMCCYLSHQGHPEAITIACTTWIATPLYLMCYLFAINLIINLTVMTLICVL